jgi:hypothetical protein
VEIYPAHASGSSVIIGERFAICLGRPEKGDSMKTLTKPGVKIVQPDPRKIIKWIDEYKRFKKSLEAIKEFNKRPLFPVTF